MIAVGQIVKPQGVRGEVKVRPLTDDPSRFCVLKSVTVGGRQLKISSVRTSPDAVYIAFEGIKDRNGAEALRGEMVYITRAAAVPLDEGEFFVADLVGATLADSDGKRIGDIRSVQSFGAADVFTVDTDDGEMSFAFVAALGARFDEAGRTLYVDAKILAEVAVYDEDKSADPVPGDVRRSQ